MGPEKAGRRHYDKEFKREAVRLVVEGRRRVTDVARDLGIGANLLHRWKRKLEENGERAFPGKGKLGAEEEAVRRLEKDLEETREERDILKKALAVFSRRGK
jgi:transposase